MIKIFKGVKVMLGWSVDEIVGAMPIWSPPPEYYIDSYEEKPISGYFVLMLRDGEKIIIFCRDGYEINLELVRSALKQHRGLCSAIYFLAERDDMSPYSQLCDLTVLRRDVANRYHCFLLIWAVINQTYRFPDIMIPSDMDIVESVTKPSIWRRPEFESVVQKVCMQFNIEYQNGPIDPQA